MVQGAGGIYCTPTMCQRVSVDDLLQCLLTIMEERCYYQSLQVRTQAKNSA